MTIKIQVSASFPAAPLVSVQIVTDAGTTDVDDTTLTLIFRKAVASPSPFNLPPGVDGAELEIFDETGLAQDMTAIPDGLDKIMGVNAPFIVASSGGIPASGGAASMKYYTAITGWKVSR